MCTHTTYTASGRYQALHHISRGAPAPVHQRAFDSLTPLLVVVLGVACGFALWYEFAYKAADVIRNVS